MTEPVLFLDGKVQLHAGDCRDRIRELADNSIDAVVTDPPYALVSIGKRFGKEGSAAVKVPEGKSGAYARASAGFMGKQWDTGETAFAAEFWAEVLRVLKPGGHVVAFSGTRTYHRMACAIEGAGFEIRDQLAWVYGSGFPKSLDVSKAIDKAAGAKREVVGFDAVAVAKQNRRPTNSTQCTKSSPETVGIITAPATPEAAAWQGWGTGLKPAWEPICLARKPLIGTVAENVLEHSTGAINIDGCRIHGPDALGGEYTVKRLKPGATLDKTGGNWRPEEGGVEYHGTMKPGRWPANIIHDGSDEVVGCFPEAPGQQADISLTAPSNKTGNIYGKMNRHGEKSADARYTDKGSTNFAALPGMRRDDSGSAARFFYAAKADSDDRLGSKHPTVKPVDLMQWLVRLVTPKGGLVLDPFAGTGTTGEAAFREGMRAILIEREPEYQADIAKRMKLVLAGPDEKRGAITPQSKPEDLPLFGGQAA